MAITKKSLDDLFSGTPTGSLERSILNNLTGINHLQTPNALPFNREMPGFTFFTRPQLNMQKGNIRNVRQLASLLSGNSTSIQHYIRCCLDPRLAMGIQYPGSGSIPADPCPIIDNMNPFIVPFTNNLISISGWPSIAVPTRNSDPGLYNEVQTIIDGRVLNDEAYTVNCNFKNTRGDVILYMLYVWCLYGSSVFEGKLVPYLDFMAENELDYNTRIYRIVTDHTKQRITKLYCCHAAIPKGVPIGDAADVPGDRTYSDANQSMSVQFECNGFSAFDDIVAMEFNEVVTIFNPAMSDNNRANYLTQIPYNLLRIFNFTGYPRINMDNGSLEWWAFNDIFQRRVSKFIDMVPETNSEEFQGD
jgi:hypothetical protein